jgi:hypothetical protein
MILDPFETGVKLILAYQKKKTEVGGTPTMHAGLGLARALIKGKKNRQQDVER